MSGKKPEVPTGAGDLWTITCETCGETFDHIERWRAGGRWPHIDAVAVLHHCKGAGEGAQQDTDRLAAIGRVIEQMMRDDYASEPKVELRVPMEFDGRKVDYVVSVRRSEPEPRLS